MKEQERDKIVYMDKHIHIARSKRGWGITILPDGIRLDNFHGFSHIHLTLDGDHHHIKYDNADEIIVFLLNHIDKNKGIDIEKLKKELFL